MCVCIIYIYIYIYMYFNYIYIYIYMYVCRFIYIYIYIYIIYIYIYNPECTFQLSIFLFAYLWLIFISLPFNVSVFLMIFQKESCVLDILKYLVLYSFILKITGFFFSLFVNRDFFASCLAILFLIFVLRYNKILKMFNQTSVAILFLMISIFKVFNFFKNGIKLFSFTV